MVTVPTVIALAKIIMSLAQTPVDLLWEYWYATIWTSWHRRRKIGGGRQGGRGEGGGEGGGEGVGGGGGGGKRRWTDRGWCIIGLLLIISILKLVDIDDRLQLRWKIVVRICQKLSHFLFSKTTKSDWIVSTRQK